MQVTRNTKQKQHILSILKDTNKPLSINDIYICCVKTFPQIAKSTVYRTINSFINQGIVEKYYLNDNELYYQIKGPFSEHKHYILCTSCNKIFDLPVCPIHTIEHCLDEFGFHMSDHYIQIEGTCKECFEKQKKQNQEDNL